MFAVPGWSVSASSLVREQARPKKTDTNSKDASKHSKKRKPDAEGAVLDSHLEYPSEGSPDHLIEKEHSSKRRKKDDPLYKISQTEKNDARSPPTPSIPSTHPIGASSGLLSKKQKKLKARDEQVKKDIKDGEDEGESLVQSTAVEVSPAGQAATKLTTLQAKMRNKLTSARFRHLNETLYTTSSADALKLFTTSPELFSDYHAGFAQQVKDSWPQNPVEGYVKSIRTRGALSDSRDGITPLPRRKTGSCTIADLGCGDAPLARGCQSVVRSLKLKFHNYDLYPANSFVTKADVSNLPLRDGEVDIAVFCLSLMGTNWIDFVEEAWRILRGDGKGEIWVAEVKSRFGRVTKGRVVENSVGKRRKHQKSKPNKEEDEFDEPMQFVEDESAPPEEDDETDITAFVKVFTRRGFQLREGSVNKRNKMFVSMIFVKTGIPTAGRHKGLKWNGKEYQKQQDIKTKLGGGSKQDDEEITIEQEGKALKACVYKVR